MNLRDFTQQILYLSFKEFANLIQTEDYEFDIYKFIKLGRFTKEERENFYMSLKRMACFLIDCIKTPSQRPSL